MPLYRLDFRDDGSPVPDRIMLDTDFLSRHMQTARARAVEVAGDTGRVVVVSRIGKTGSVRPAIVIRPDGGAEAPDGMRQGGGVDCTTGTLDQPCFCRNCRAERRGR